MNDVDLVVECPVCMGFLKGPVLLPCCGTHMCCDCLKRCLDTCSSNCPLCRGYLRGFARRSAKVDVDMERRLKAYHQSCNGSPGESSGASPILSEHNSKRRLNRVLSTPGELGKEWQDLQRKAREEEEARAWCATKAFLEKDEEYQLGVSDATGSGSMSDGLGEEARRKAREDAEAENLRSTLAFLETDEEYQREKKAQVSQEEVKHAGDGGGECTSAVPAGKAGGNNVGGSSSSSSSAQVVVDSSRARAAGHVAKTWTCAQCTFLNSPAWLRCEMCKTPKAAVDMDRDPLPAREQEGLLGHFQKAPSGRVAVPSTAACSPKRSYANNSSSSGDNSSNNALSCTEENGHGGGVKRRRMGTEKNPVELV